MKKILAIYYSQTGQLKKLLTNFLSGYKDKVTFSEIKTSQYGFPLTWNSMFEMFPESVLQIPCKISYNIPIDNYDTIIIGFQTWFLHLSLPILTFSQTNDFLSAVKGKNVYLFMDCRNSWRTPMKLMKEKVNNAGGYVIGEYVYGSISGNFIGSISILHWFFTGVKKMLFFSEPGVPENEIKMAMHYGNKYLGIENRNKVMRFPIGKNKFLPIKTEKYASSKFEKWAKYIVKNDCRHRKLRLIYFKIWLISIQIIISPILYVYRIICKFK
jgi:hypothetical protein